MAKYRRARGWFKAQDLLFCQHSVSLQSFISMEYWNKLKGCPICFIGDFWSMLQSPVQCMLKLSCYDVLGSAYKHKLPNSQHHVRIPTLCNRFNIWMWHIWIYNKLPYCLEILYIWIVKVPPELIRSIVSLHAIKMWILGFLIITLHHRMIPQHANWISQYYNEWWKMKGLNMKFFKKLLLTSIYFWISLFLKNVITITGESYGE